MASKTRKKSKGNPAHYGKKRRLADSQPIELETSATEREPEERVRVFSIDGKWYTIPAKIAPGVTLTYLRKIVDDGENNAAAWLMLETLGRKAFMALETWPDLTPEIFESVMERVKDVTMGGMENPKGR